MSDKLMGMTDAIGFSSESESDLFDNWNLIKITFGFSKIFCSIPAMPTTLKSRLISRELTGFYADFLSYFAIVPQLFRFSHI